MWVSDCVSPNRPNVAPSPSTVASTVTATAPATAAALRRCIRPSRDPFGHDHNGRDVRP